MVLTRLEFVGRILSAFSRIPKCLIRELTDNEDVLFTY